MTDLPQPESCPLLVGDIYKLLGRDGKQPVLLHLEAGKKGPDWKGWRCISYSETMMEGPYQTLLYEKANTGVRLGDDDLCTIDCDTDAFLAEMLRLNPGLHKTFCSCGETAGQLWGYWSGERPRQVHPLKVHKDSPLAVGLKDPKPDKDGMVAIGEWRAEGGQSVIRGIHPCGRAYSYPHGAIPPKEFNFEQIAWPADIAIPWEARKEPAYDGSSAAEDSLLRRAIAQLTVEQLWDHFGYPPRRGNPVRSPFREDKHPSFSIYDQGRRFKDHGWSDHRGDSFDFYQLATKEDSKTAFKSFVELAGLGHELHSQESNEQERPRDMGDDWVETDEEREQRLFEELSSKYQNALVSFGEFCSLDIKPRQCLIGKWMKEADSGFVFGQRGAGKTWLVDLLVSHLSNGQDIDEDWNVPKQGTVVLVDGEMPWDDSKTRLAGLGADPAHLFLLHHEVLFERTGLDMNLADKKVQQIITGLCESKQAKLLVLETLSSLFRGISESDADAWEAILHWLLDLRRRRIAVLIVLHAGWNGDHARGSSRREDDVFWVIKVAEITDRNPDETGAKFETEFTKFRNLDAPPPTRHWHVVTESDGAITYSSDDLTFNDKVLAKIQAGLRSASDIAAELKVAKSTVSKAAARLEELKLIERKGNGNRITYEPRGFMCK